MKAKPKAQSLNCIVSGAVNRSGNVCLLEKRAGKTKSGVSTQVKTKKGSSGVSTPVRTKAPARSKRHPRVAPMPTTLWTHVTANEFTAEATTERGRVWKNQGFDVSSAACKEAARPLCKKSLATRSTAENESDLENAL